jgi:glycosyltransferase involved in cell wall biosynthesis
MEYKQKSKKKLLVISQLEVWDMKRNAGRAVLDKTLTTFSNSYNLTIIAPGDSNVSSGNNFFKLNNNIEKKIGKVFLIGHLYRYIGFYMFYLKVNKIIKQNKIEPDIVYLIGYYSAFTGKKIFKKGVFLVNRYFGVAWQEKNLNSLRHKLKFFIRNYCYKHFGHIVIMTNDGTKGDLFLKHQGLQSDKLYFLKNGIDMSFETIPNFKVDFFETHRINTDTIIFLTVSRLTGWKRVDRAINALSKIKNEISDFRLIIIGDGEEKSKLEELAIDKKIKDNVIFTGSITHDILPNYYQMTDVFLSLYEYSNAGNPLFEAMLHKRAIITVNNGDTNNFIDKNSCLFVDDYDEPQLIKHLAYLSKNQSVRIELGQNAYEKLIKTFNSWDQRLSNEVDIINENYNDFLVKRLNA